jgi:uncharacterized surface protein with fasciclin (FAS1) repeats
MASWMTDALALQKVLEGHIVVGQWMVADLVRSLELLTFCGTRVTLSRSEQALRYGDSTILRCDILASNGILHVVTDLVVQP